MKSLTITVIVAVVFFIFGMATCKHCTPPCEVKTEYKTDTTKTVAPTESSDYQEPSFAGTTGSIPDSLHGFKPISTLSPRIEPVPITDGTWAEKYHSLLLRYNALYNDYLKVSDDYNRLYGFYSRTNIYSDSSRFKNGTVHFKGWVQGNQIIRDSFGLSNVPLLTITNTVTKEAERRLTGFLGIGGLYLPSDTSLYIGASFSLQFKNGAIGSIRGYYNGTNRYMVGGEYAVPLRLGRKKK